MNKVLSSLFVAASALFLFPTFVPRADTICSTSMTFNVSAPKSERAADAVKVAKDGFCKTYKIFTSLYFL